MRKTWKTAAVLLSVVVLAGLGGLARAQQGCPSCGGGICLPEVPRSHCPPPYCHIQEGPPHIHYKCGCPAPVCNPCDLPHYGYFQPCWRPWPYPPDWSHCPEVPPAALINPGPLPPNTTTNLPGEPETTPFPSGLKKAPEQLPLPMSGAGIPEAKPKF